jgi:hypothetical protein
MEESDAAEGVAVQLIDGEGEFAAEGAERFMAAAGVAGCGLSYAVVSIMGPQSSGTLCLHRLRSQHRSRPALDGPSTKAVGLVRYSDPELDLRQGHACVRAGRLFDGMLRAPSIMRL